MKNDNIYFDKEKTKGRPKLVLNEHGAELVYKLSKIMCKDSEIAAILEVSVETLKAKQNIEIYLRNRQKGQSEGKSSLRRWQFECAEKGNASLLIWLGKQYLDQTDKKAEDQTWQNENTSEGINSDN